MKKTIEERYKTTPLSGGNAPFVEHYYEIFLADPGAVPESWRTYFESVSDPSGSEVARGPIEAELRQARGRPSADLPRDLLEKQVSVNLLVEAYRLRGHLLADLDPLGQVRRERPAEIDPATYGLGDADMETRFATAGVKGRPVMRLKNIIEHLERVYGGTIGAELAHITSAEERQWLQERFESAVADPEMSEDDRRNILLKLTAAEGIERYLHTRYVGQKRFSLEGGDCLIPLVYNLIQRGGQAGLEEVVIGMAHRGRINVLVNIMGKSPRELFSEFEGAYDPNLRAGSGDVKYHLGF
jgi:2-oxoglutarate dehydrogenase E1 component